jgi:hypothetical protein
MADFFWNACRDDETQDIAEYAVMLAVISRARGGHDPIGRLERKQWFFIRRKFGSLTSARALECP